MTSPDLHQIRLGPNAVSEALDQVACFCKAEGREPAPVLAVIVEELVFNLVDHGTPGESGIIEIGLRRSPEGIVLTLVDDCAPFDLRDAAPVGDLPPADRGGGAGIAIVLAWSRILSYSRLNGRNRLELIIPDG